MIAQFSSRTEDPIFLYHVQCDGTERQLTDCHYNQFNTNYCDHGSDIGVVCQGKLKHSLNNYRKDIMQVSNNFVSPVRKIWPVNQSYCWYAATQKHRTVCSIMQLLEGIHNCALSQLRVFNVTLRAWARVYITVYLTLTSWELWSMTSLTNVFDVSSSWQLIAAK